MNNWVCIDFGTCNTAAAIDIDGSPHVVSVGNIKLFPTIACVLSKKDIEVCQDAEPLRLKFPDTFIQEFKLQIAEDIDINSVTYTDIVTEILKYIKGCAEINNNGEEISKAILTIPAIYTESDKRKTVMRNAAKKAGFTKIEFLSEPQAAAYHYADISGASCTGISLIYDLGGGTFDPALLDMTISKQPKILGFDSGVKCGGQYFDKVIYQYLASKFKNAGKPLSRSNRLEDFAACKRLKESLSIKEKSTICLSNEQEITITREEINSLIKPLINLTLQSCDNLISTANRSWADINQILLVGGSTTIPLIRSMLEKHLMSHNATSVKIIRNTKGQNGEYDHIFATCLGGISSKILPPPPPPEKIAIINNNGNILQLKLGENKFGRDPKMDFHFDDPSMSRHHFSIVVSKDTGDRLTYTITSHSKSKATILNNIEALDARYAPISRISTFLEDGFTITAGKTKFVFKKID